MPLNDPHWGRGSSDDDEKSTSTKEPSESTNKPNDEPPKVTKPRRPRREEPQTDDIEELWEKLAGIFGGDDAPRRPRRGPKPELKGRDDFSRDESDDVWSTKPMQDDRRSESAHDDAMPRARSIFGQFGASGTTPPAVGGKLVSFVAGLLVVLWASTGFYIVPEGQEGVVTTFGKYTTTTMPGFRWHMPEPIQSVDLVDVSRVRTTEIGAPGRPLRLKEALMLTDDENIVDLQFTVQYRIKPGEAQHYVFNLRDPEMTVQQVAESAMREVVGRKTMDSVLFESKAEIADAVRRTMQDTLDRYKSGIEIMSVAIQNAQPPEPVQAAFNDAVKAGQDRERAINLGEAYRNAILPKAQGSADRLREEAHGYSARVTQAASGEAQRFKDLLVQYKAQPQVTRDRLYVDAMKDIYTQTSKVMIDAKASNPLLYVPLDKLTQGVKEEAQKAAEEGTEVRDVPVNSEASAPATSAPPSKATSPNRLNRLRL